jgi:hypothetical protein
MEKMISTRSIGRLAAVVALVAVAMSPLQIDAQNTTIKGIFFGDYYGAVSHNDPDVDQQTGFWMRRMYLTINSKFNDNWDSRVRFEANSPGNFTSTSKMEPFVKDLWVRWRSGNQKIILGLSSSPTWNLWESQWGYRFLEKTPLDLFKFGSSRDFGIAFQGSLGEGKKIRYHAMLGNGSSTKGETNAGKKIMGSLQFFATDNLTFEVYADREDRPENKDRQTFNGSVFLRGDRGRVGFLASHQDRKTPGEPDVNVNLFSVFGVLEVSEKANIVARWDRMASPIPDAAKVSYFRMDPTSKGNFFLIGLDLKMDDRVRLVPNIEVVSYDDSGINSDVFLKTTFYVKF